jgi:UrcA family protein
MKPMTRTFRIPSLVAMLLAATPFAAVAAEGIDSFTFRFSRSALATPEGVEQVYADLARRARRACDSIGTGTELWRTKLRRTCRATLVDKVVASARAPQLLARHQGTWYHELARLLERDQAQQNARPATARVP